jgi:hypothetical protein
MNSHSSIADSGKLATHEQQTLVDRLVQAVDGTRSHLEELSEAVQHQREEATGGLTALKD